MQPQGPQMQGHGPPVGAVMRPQHHGPPGSYPMQGQRPMIIQQGPIMQQGQWIRHPQEVTLQQRGPMGLRPPGPQVMAIRGPGPIDQHPALIRQDSNTQPPPPPLNTKPMTPPPENPETDEDKAKVHRYEQWLMQQEQAINEHLKYYETEISKLRKLRKVSLENQYKVLFLCPSFIRLKLTLKYKTKKNLCAVFLHYFPHVFVTFLRVFVWTPVFHFLFQSLSSKQRTMRKNGNDLNEKDQNELDQVSLRAQEIQKTLEKIRKQSRQHAMLTSDHKNKKQKAMGIDPSKPDEAGMQHQGMPQQQQQQQQIVMQQPHQGHLGHPGMMQGPHGHRMQIRPGMNPGQPRMMVLQQQQQQMVMRPQGQPQMQRMVMMQGHPQQRMVMMTQGGQPIQGHPGGQRMQMIRMPQGTMMRMQQPYDPSQGQGPPQMNSPGMSPHHSSQPSPHSMHTSGQPSPQSYPVTSPGGAHGRPPGMTSPMSMPVTSPSPGMNVMSPMNPPSQSPQPVMSPQQFHHQQHHGFSGSQSPATSVSQSPRNVSVFV